MRRWCKAAVGVAVCCRASTGTPAAPPKPPTTPQAPKSAGSLRVPRFDDSRAAHGHKSMTELLRTLLVMRMIRINYLAENTMKIVKLSEKVFGIWLTYLVIKYLPFHTYCGEEHMQKLKASVSLLESRGIGSILDYAAEAEDAGGGTFEVKAMQEICSDKTIQYLEPAKTFNANMSLNLLCVGHASLMLPKFGDGFAALKFSGLTDPLLLIRTSALQLALRQAWLKFVEDSPPPLEECRVVIGQLTKDGTRRPRFQSVSVVRAGLKKHTQALPMTDEELEKIIAVLDPKGTGKVDYLTYVHHVTEALLSPSSPGGVVWEPYMRSLPRMTEEEVQLWQDLKKRVRTILTVAKELNVKVMVDAEQTYVQMAIDYITREFQREFNKTEPLIYNTYQCYLTHGQQRLLNDIDRSKEEGWLFAVKLVRGAYMKQENALAKRNNYASPVWPNAEATHRCYDETADIILNLIEENPDKKYGVLFGTHNPESLTRIAARVAKLPSNHCSSVAFAQLYGMADHLTTGLAQAGYTVFKYIPYGPVKETIQYLARRATENNDVLKGTRKVEYDLLVEEIKYRLFRWTKNKKDK